MPPTTYQLPSGASEREECCGRQECLASCARQECLASCARQECLASCDRQECLASCDRQECLASCARQECLASCDRQECLSSCARQECLLTRSQAPAWEHPACEALLRALLRLGEAELRESACPSGAWARGAHCFCRSSGTRRHGVPRLHIRRHGVPPLLWRRRIARARSPCSSNVSPKLPSRKLLSTGGAGGPSFGSPGCP